MSQGLIGVLLQALYNTRADAIKLLINPLTEPVTKPLSEPLTKFRKV